jgi:hypothetical protein
MNIRQWPQRLLANRRSRPGESACTDVCDFQVIGELKDNPHSLLLMGDDGQCYAYDIIEGEITPLDPDDSWAMDLAFPSKAGRPERVSQRTASQYRP